MGSFPYAIINGERRRSNISISVVFFAIVGAVLGSFSCAAGMNTGGYWHRRRSVCDSCGRELRVYELIPILSYLMLRGRCSSCGARIPRICLAAEVYGAVLGGAAGYVYEGLWLELAMAMLVLTAVIVQTVTDIREGMLYDWASWLVLGAGCMYRGFIFWSSGFTDWSCVMSGLIGIGLAAVFYGGLHLLGGMGSGDILLSAGFGALIGGWGIYFMTLTASVVTLTAVGCLWFMGRLKPKGGSRVAFGPGLCLAGYSVFLIQSYFQVV